MSVVRLKESNAAEAAAGAAMDRPLLAPKRPRWLVAALGALALAGAGVGAWRYAPGAGSETVAADRLTISAVTRGTFEDFLPLRARVTPLVTVYLDAVAGGRVDKVLVEDGATVAQGQLLAVLSNADLQLATLRSETDVAQQLNNLRSAELDLARTRLNDARDVADAEADYAKARRLYELQAPLAGRGFVAARTWGDTRDEYRQRDARLVEIRRAQATDARLQGTQLAQLRATAASLSQALAIARRNLDQLNLRAPVAGQLTAFSIQVGQSASRGERLGQIDSPGRNKLTADVDEYHLGRVAIGQRAAIEAGGKAYALRVAKIYPQVKNGTFAVDFQFTGPEPAGLQRGQSVDTRLTLGDPAPARLLPNGAFYNETGGTWVFVVAPDGRSAVKRQVRLGRRNADHIEVLDGLDPGERVITSPYTGLADKSRLDLADPAS